MMPIVPRRSAPRSTRYSRTRADETLTQSERDFFGSQIERVGNIGFIVNSIIGAVLFALLFVTGNTMMQSIRERVPEFAVLKTYGFSNLAINLLVFAESALLCVTAAVVGLVVAAAAVPDDVRRDGRLRRCRWRRAPCQRRRPRGRAGRGQLVVADVARAAHERRRRARGSLEGRACCARSPPFAV